MFWMAFSICVRYINVAWFQNKQTEKPKILFTALFCEENISGKDVGVGVSSSVKQAV